VYFLIFFFSAFCSSFSGAPTAPPEPAPSAMKLSRRARGPSRALIKTQQIGLD